MQFTFLDMTGVALFVRDDAESAQWTQEEKALSAVFPYDAEKVISIGQRIFFIDPSTGSHEIYEIRNAATIQPDAYQQITAEHICISELTDDHIAEVNLYGVTPQRALSTVLTGTLWSVGTVSVGDLEEQQELITDITALGLNGNVDLTARPIVYPDKMKAAGYTDFEGDYATLYSFTYAETIKSGDAYTLLMTPIEPNGDVLSEDDLDEYVAGLCDTYTTIADLKAHDTKKLLIHYLSGTQVEAMDEIAEDAHTLSDDWETLNNGVLSSAELSKGSVWQDVLNIQTNWNVYIVPRVVLSDSGSITRYLDITNTQGTWNGVRLSIDKNFLDPSVTYDDTELVTALYGYGGTIHKPGTSGDSETCTFANVVWTATDDHPAKPSGQLYLEDPAATSEFGRNGRARFGFYQNTEITDPEILLQKTWETLKETSTPTISIEGTVADLYRMGYGDQPIKLNDIALVEVLPAGFKKQLQIIRMTVNLLDPSETVLTIGAYIPNIIYIDRNTNDSLTGTRGGNGNKNTETERREFETAIESINDGTGLRFRAFQNDLNDLDAEQKLQEGRITVNYNLIQSEVVDRRDADNILSSSITQTASAIRSEVSATASNLQSVILQTASSILSVVGQKSRVFVQFSTPAGASENDIWVKSNGLYTNGAMGEMTNAQLGEYDFRDFYGSEIYVLHNGTWELCGNDQLAQITQTQIEQTDEHVAIIAGNMTGDYAQFIVEIGRIRSEVVSLDNEIQSAIEQTASAIAMAVWTANSEMYSEILQTQSMIRSTVGDLTPGTTVMSVITQTASSINMEVAKKAVIYPMWSDPSSSYTINAGDIWIKIKDIYTNGEMAEYTNGQLNSYYYKDFFGSEMFVWENGAWKPLSSEQAQNIEHTIVEIDEKHFKALSEDVAGNYAEFLVEKGQIRSIVENQAEKLGSSITQTASEIRAEVHAADSQIYSALSITASQIRSEVASATSGLSSTITQTASSIRIELRNAISNVNATITTTASTIRSEVSAANSTVYSTITQTASSIRSEVASTTSSLSSSITQTASAIRTEVSAANSTIYSKITQTADTIRSEVSSANSTVYSTITQTASSIKSYVNGSLSGVYSYVQQTASSIITELRNSISGVRSIITQTASSIRSEVASATSSLSSSITQNADRIALVVEQDSQGNDKIKTASIVAGINAQTGSYVKIAAATINLSGYVTASALNATDAKITNLTSGSSTAASLKTQNLYVTTNNMYHQGHKVNRSVITIGGVNYNIMTWTGD